MENQNIEEMTSDNFDSEIFLRGKLRKVYSLKTDYEMNIPKITAEENDFIQFFKKISIMKNLKIFGIFGKAYQLQNELSKIENNSKLDFSDLVLKEKEKAAIFCYEKGNLFIWLLVTEDIFFEKKLDKENCIITIFRYLQDISQNIILLIDEKIISNFENSKKNIYEEQEAGISEFVIEESNTAKLRIEDIQNINLNEDSILELDNFLHKDLISNPSNFITGYNLISVNIQEKINNFENFLRIFFNNLIKLNHLEDESIEKMVNNHVRGEMVGNEKKIKEILKYRSGKFELIYKKSFKYISRYIYDCCDRIENMWSILGYYKYYKIEEKDIKILIEMGIENFKNFLDKLEISNNEYYIPELSYNLSNKFYLELYKNMNQILNIDKIDEPNKDFLKNSYDIFNQIKNGIENSVNALLNNLTKFRRKLLDFFNKEILDKMKKSFILQITLFNFSAPSKNTGENDFVKFSKDKEFCNFSLKLNDIMDSLKISEKSFSFFKDNLLKIYRTKSKHHLFIYFKNTSKEGISPLYLISEKNQKFITSQSYSPDFIFIKDLELCIFIDYKKCMIKKMEIDIYGKSSNDKSFNISKKYKEKDYIASSFSNPNVFILYLINENYEILKLNIKTGQEEIIYPSYVNENNNICKIKNDNSARGRLFTNILSFTNECYFILESHTKIDVFDSKGGYLIYSIDVIENNKFYSYGCKIFSDEKSNEFLLISKIFKDYDGSNQDEKNINNYRCFIFKDFLNKNRLNQINFSKNDEIKNFKGNPIIDVIYLSDYKFGPLKGNFIGLHNYSNFFLKFSDEIDLKSRNSLFININNYEEGLLIRNNYKILENPDSSTIAIEIEKPIELAVTLLTRLSSHIITIEKGEFRMLDGQNFEAFIDPKYYSKQKFSIIEEIFAYMKIEKTPIVSIVGKQSGGKSYLLNRVFGTRFSVSGTRCTDGIWMGSAKIQDKFFLIFDCEGLFSAKRNEIEEIKYLTFLFAISDFVIINQDLNFNRNLIELLNKLAGDKKRHNLGENLFKSDLYFRIIDVDPKENENAKKELRRVFTETKELEYLRNIFKKIIFQPMVNYKHGNFERDLKSFKEKIFQAEGHWEKTQKMFKIFKFLIKNLSDDDNNSPDKLYKEYEKNEILKELSDLFLTGKCSDKSLNNKFIYNTILNNENNDIIENKKESDVKEQGEEKKFKNNDIIINHIDVDLNDKVNLIIEFFSKKLEGFYLENNYQINKYFYEDLQKLINDFKKDRINLIIEELKSNIEKNPDIKEFEKDFKNFIFDLKNKIIIELCNKKCFNCNLKCIQINSHNSDAQKEREKLQEKLTEKEQEMKLLIYYKEIIDNKYEINILNEQKENIEKRLRKNEYLIEIIKKYKEFKSKIEILETKIDDNKKTIDDFQTDIFKLNSQHNFNNLEEIQENLCDKGKTLTIDIIKSLEGLEKIKNFQIINTPKINEFKIFFDNPFYNIFTNLQKKITDISLDEFVSEFGILKTSMTNRLNDLNSSIELFNDDVLNKIKILGDNIEKNQNQSKLFQNQIKQMKEETFYLENEVIKIDEAIEKLKENQKNIQSEKEKLENEITFCVKSKMREIENEKNYKLKLEKIEAIKNEKIKALSDGGRIIRFLENEINIGFIEESNEILLENLKKMEENFKINQNFSNFDLMKKEKEVMECETQIKKHEKNERMRKINEDKKKKYLDEIEDFKIYNQSQDKINLINEVKQKFPKIPSTYDKEIFNDINIREKIKTEEENDSIKKKIFLRDIIKIGNSIKKYKNEEKLYLSQTLNFFKIRESDLQNMEDYINANLIQNEILNLNDLIFELENELQNQNSFEEIKINNQLKNQIEKEKGNVNEPDNKERKGTSKMEEEHNVTERDNGDIIEIDKNEDKSEYFDNYKLFILNENKEVKEIEKNHLQYKELNIKVEETIENYDKEKIEINYAIDKPEDKSKEIDNLSKNNEQEEIDIVQDKLKEKNEYQEKQNEKIEDQEKFNRIDNSDKKEITHHNYIIKYGLDKGKMSIINEESKTIRMNFELIIQFFQQEKKITNKIQLKNLISYCNRAYSSFNRIGGLSDLFKEKLPNLEGTIKDYTSFIDELLKEEFNLKCSFFKDDLENKFKDLKEKSLLLNKEEIKPGFKDEDLTNFIQKKYYKDNLDNLLIEYNCKNEKMFMEITEFYFKYIVDEDYQIKKIDLFKLQDIFENCQKYIIFLFVDDIVRIFEESLQIEKIFETYIFHDNLDYDTQVENLLKKLQNVQNLIKETEQSLEKLISKKENLLKLSKESDDKQIKYSKEKIHISLKIKENYNNIESIESRIHLLELDINNEKLTRKDLNNIIGGKLHIIIKEKINKDIKEIIKNFNEFTIFLGAYFEKENANKTVEKLEIVNVEELELVNAMKQELEQEKYNEITEELNEKELLESSKKGIEQLEKFVDLLKQTEKIRVFKEEIAELKEIQENLTKKMNVSCDCKTDHKCKNKCKICPDKICSSIAGHENEHLCENKMHSCSEKCEKFEKCKKQCIKNMNEPHKHDCGQSHPCESNCIHCEKNCVKSRDEDHTEHLCNIKKCTKLCILCKNQCTDENHDHYLKTDTIIFNSEEVKLHLCNSEHYCYNNCSITENCEIYYNIEVREWKTETETTTYNYHKPIFKQKKCKIIIPPGKISHDGPCRCDYYHKCNIQNCKKCEDLNGHRCVNQCPQCGSYCDHVKGHTGKHDTTHRNMERCIFAQRERYEPPLPSGGSENGGNEKKSKKYKQKDSAVAEICDLNCINKGRGHLHLKKCLGGDECWEKTLGKDFCKHSRERYYPNLDEMYDLVTCNTYWDKLNFENPNKDKPFIENFELCNFYCPHKNTDEMDRKKLIFCSNKILHSDSNQRSDHNFECKHLEVKKIQIGFLIDCTSSMNEWIDKTKVTVTSIVKRLKKDYPNINLEFAICGYRDHIKKPNGYGEHEAIKVIEKLDFTNDEESLKFLGNLNAIGGGDLCEAVVDGLNAVNNFSWDLSSGARKVVFMILDYPPHGKEFYGEENLKKNDSDDEENDKFLEITKGDPLMGILLLPLIFRVRNRYDDFPNGCPCGLDYKTIIEKFVEKRIIFKVVKWTIELDLMMERFKNLNLNISELRIDKDNIENLPSMIEDQVCRCLQDDDDLNEINI